MLKIILNEDGNFIDELECTHSRTEVETVEKGDYSPLGTVYTEEVEYCLDCNSEYNDLYEQWIDDNIFTTKAELDKNGSIYKIVEEL